MAPKKFICDLVTANNDNSLIIVKLGTYVPYVILFIRAEETEKGVTHTRIHNAHDYSKIGFREKSVSLVTIEPNASLVRTKNQNRKDNKEIVFLQFPNKSLYLKIKDGQLGITTGIKLKLDPEKIEIDGSYYFVAILINDNIEYTIENPHENTNPITFMLIEGQKA